MNKCSNSTHKKKRKCCDICEINTNIEQVTYSHYDCIKSGCNAIGHHVHFVCIECEASGKRLICEKCGKFANLRISIREKLDMMFSINLLVCEECHKKKRNICDICEKSANRSQVFYYNHTCIKPGCEAIAYHFHSVCTECEASGSRQTCDKCGKFCSSISYVFENSFWRSVCDECRNNKLNTCDICEVDVKTRRFDYNCSECIRSDCERRRKHFHFICIGCEASSMYYQSVCYKCKAKRKNRKIFLHNFVKRCNINDCNEQRQHEHYLCEECNRQRIR